MRHARSFVDVTEELRILFAKVDSINSNGQVNLNSRPLRFRHVAQISAALFCCLAWLPLGATGCRQKPAKPPLVESRESQSMAEHKPDVTNGESPGFAPDPPKKIRAARSHRIPPNEPIDLTKPIVDENGVTFVPTQLNKNNSLLVLALEPDIRAEFIVMTVRTILASDQLIAAKQMALTYEDQFRDLKRERAAILSTAGSVANIDRKVVKVQMKMAMLIRQIRTRISAEIMTADQRKESHRLYLEKMAEKTSREAAKSGSAKLP